MTADEVTSLIAALSSTDRGAGDSLTATMKQLSAGGNDAAATALVTELSELKTVIQRQADAVTENTGAVAENTTAKATAGEPASVTAGKTAGSILSSGFGLAPLFTGLFHLFGGGGSEAEEIVYPKATRPASIRLETLYSQADETRADAMSERAPSEGSGAGAASLAAGGRQAPAQITIQVQALDSRSFLDHRDEIARAVRSAMLNSNSLNDVVTEL